MNQLSLKGKVALITGAAQGLGKVLAETFAGADACVLASDIQVDRGEEVVDAIRKSGKEASFVQADLSRAEERKSLIEETVGRFDALDIIVNNARVRMDKRPFPENMDSWDMANEVMLKAPADLVAQALPHLDKSSNASIINISSVAGRFISDQPIGYHLTKAGMDHLTRYLACSLGERSIRVNAICPGLVDFEDRPRNAKEAERRSEIIEATVPLGQATSALDTATLAVFMASDAAQAMTGQIVTVDGGMTLGDQFYCGGKIRDNKSG